MGKFTLADLEKRVHERAKASGEVQEGDMVLPAIWGGS